MQDGHSSCYFLSVNWKPIARLIPTYQPSQKTTMKTFLLSVTSSLALLVTSGFAHAQSAYPSEKPVTMLVPFAAGGGTDILARLLADKLGEELKQSFVVQNKPGANGLIAIRSMEQSKADGYTLLLGSSSTHMLAPLMSDEKNFINELQKKSTVVSIIADTPLVLAINSKSNIGNLNDMLKLAQNKSLTFGTFGTGTSPHVLGEVLATNTKTMLDHVPYKGSSLAVNDLRGGHIDSVFLTIAAVNTQIDANELRPLAVTGIRRVPTLPSVPTFKELGISGLEDAGWFALFAPAGSPKEVLDMLHESVTKVMAMPVVQSKLVELGLQNTPMSRSEAQQVWIHSTQKTKQMLQQIKLGTK